MSDLTSRRLAPWRVRVWVVRIEGRLAGALVASRWAFDDWHASAFIADERAAAPLARRLDRSPVRSVAGAGADVSPLRGAARRAVDLTWLPCVVLPPPITLVGEPDDTTRLATMADLDALTELYQGYELYTVPTRWQLRQMLRRALATGMVIVAERDGALVGAAIVSARTTRWGVLDALTVLPASRGSGVAWAIAARAQALANAIGVGGVFTLADSNPMRFDEQGAGEEWGIVGLVPRHRFPGQGRLRSLYGAVCARSVRPTVTLRSRDGA